MCLFFLLFSSLGIKYGGWWRFPPPSKRCLLKHYLCECCLASGGGGIFSLGWNLSSDTITAGWIPRWAGWEHLPDGTCQCSCSWMIVISQMLGLGFVLSSAVLPELGFLTAWIPQQCREIIHWLGLACGVFWWGWKLQEWTGFYNWNVLGCGNLAILLMVHMIWCV